MFRSLRPPPPSVSVPVPPNPTPCASSDNSRNTDDSRRGTISTRRIERCATARGGNPSTRSWDGLRRRTIPRPYNPAWPRGGIRRDQSPSSRPIVRGPFRPWSCRSSDGWNRDGRRTRRSPRLSRRRRRRHRTEHRRIQTPPPSRPDLPPPPPTSDLSSGSSSPPPDPSPPRPRLRPGRRTERRTPSSDSSRTPPPSDRPRST
mmetsp:Transcript_27833/g.81690  ORF Transcript_27833/g.81690 Transcript_27833/m.81690 type:complete len:203 (-) Transcript_27833:257-865(-)